MIFILLPVKPVLFRRDKRAQILLKLNNDILRCMSLSTKNCLENQLDILTAGQAGLTCGSNRSSGRKQKPFRVRASKPEGTREEVLPMALYKLLESISFTVWRMSRFMLVIHFVYVMEDAKFNAAIGSRIISCAPI